MVLESFIQEKVKKLPEKPGVYQFFNNSGELLYIGKAKNLKKRVASYFTRSDAQNYKQEVLVKKIADLQYILVEDESDALLLENNLIKEFQPKYNILLKDDKTFPWIVIRNERFPRVYQTRNTIDDGSEYFGPYTSGVMVKSMLDLIRQLFKLRTCSLTLSEEGILKGKFKRCLEYHIGNCLAPCEGLQSESEYREAIDQIKEILKGNYHQVIQQLRRMMTQFAREYRFEEAELVRKKIEALEKYKGKSTIVNPAISQVDVFSLVNDENRAFVNFLKISKGSVVQSHNLEIIKKIDEPDAEILASVIYTLRDRFKSMAREVIVPLVPALDFHQIKWTIPKRGDKKKLLDLSERNATSYKKDRALLRESAARRDSQPSLLTLLQKDLKLRRPPERIECFDNSNIQGQYPVASCVVFKSGRPLKSEYRHYNIKTVEGPDDFASMSEVVFRRYKRLMDEGIDLPELIIIDGGKGQLNAAVKCLEQLNIRKKVELIGIAKRLEEIYVPGDPVPLYLDKNSQSLRLIQRIRDEAHRFGITFHRNKRSKDFLKSALDTISGIGEKTREKILKQYRNLEDLKKLEIQELEGIAGKKAAKILYSYFHANDTQV